jgi:hypothetical protein
MSERLDERGNVVFRLGVPALGVNFCQDVEGRAVKMAATIQAVDEGKGQPRLRAQMGSD